MVEREYEENVLVIHGKVGMHNLVVVQVKVCGCHADGVMATNVLE